MNSPLILNVLRTSVAIIAIQLPLLSHAASPWTWHTFPGKAHTENPGPWQDAPYRGTDRCEWISAFGASPVLAEGHDAPFMMMVTDIGGLVYSDDGTSFVPAPLPYTGGVAVGFDPHDGNTGYAILHKHFQFHVCYLFRTHDRGQSWERLTEASYYRKQRNFIAVNPDPDSRNHIYIATTAGVKRSLDDGATWEIIPETADLEIRTIRFNSDGTSLYVINGANLDKDLSTGDLNLYRLDFTDTDGAYTFSKVREAGARDIHPHPDNPDRALLLNRFSRYIWTEDRGVSDGVEITPDGLRNASWSMINPENPDHIVTFGHTQPDVAMAWSLDGGDSWNYHSPTTVNGKSYWSSFTDYSPFVHGNPNSWLSNRFDTILEGRRHNVSFWPGQPSWLVSYGLTQEAKAPILSKDWGATWKPFAWGGMLKQVSQMAIGSTDDIMAMGRNEHGLVYTGNGGLWWAASTGHNDPVLDEIQRGSSIPDWSKNTFHGIGIDPENDSHWIGLTGNGPAWIVRSTDQGATWEKVFEATDFDLGASTSWFHRRWIHWHQQNPDIIYVGSWRSVDRGVTWTQLPSTRAVTDMSTENGDVVVHRDFGFYYTSFDAGETWNPLPEARNPVTLATYELPNGRFAGTMAIDPDPTRDPTVPGQYFRFIIGTREGVIEFNATNQDATAGTWTYHTTGIVTDDDQWIEPNQRIYLTAAAFDPRPGMHHIAYVAGGLGYISGQTRFLTNDKYHRQVYRSEDGGITWNRIVSESDVDSGTVPAYMTAVGALYVSPNTGKLFMHSYAGMHVYDPSEVNTQSWYGYPVTDNGWVDTSPWLQWVNITFDPWVWSTSLDKYIYLTDDSGWVYVP